MICSNCNAENADGAIFCSRCGGRLESIPKKKSKNKIIFIVIPIVVIVLFMVLLLILKKNPVEKFFDYYNSGEYVKANEIYGKKISGNIDYENEVFDYLSNSINSSWDSYIGGMSSSEDLDKDLEKVHTVDGTAKIMDVLTNIEDKYQVIKDSEAAFEDGKSKQDVGELLAAIDSYNKVSSEDPFNYDSAQNAIISIKDEYSSNLIAVAEDYIANKQYAEALDVLEEAGMYSEDQENINTLKREATTNNFEEKLKDSISNNQFAKAKKCYADAQKNTFCNISEEMIKLYKDFSEEVRISYLTAARETYKEEGYLAAIDVIKNGLQDFPGDKTMKAYQDLLASTEPVLLKSLTLMDSHCAYDDVKEKTDKFDNSYTNCIGLSTMNVYDTPNRAFAKYLLDNKYTTMTFKIFNASNVSGSKICVRVIADDLKIYESEYFTSQDRTKEVTVNVKNAEVVEINANHLKGSGTGYAMFADAYVFRELTDEDFENLN